MFFLFVKIFCCSANYRSHSMSVFSSLATWCSISLGIRFRTVLTLIFLSRWSLRWGSSGKISLKKDFKSTDSPKVCLTFASVTLNLCLNKKFLRCVQEIVSSPSLQRFLKIYSGSKSSNWKRVCFWLSSCWPNLVTEASMRASKSSGPTFMTLTDIW